MYLLILLLPLLGFLFTILFGRFIGLGSFIISTSSIFLTLLLTIIAFYEVVYNSSTVYIDLGYWINLNHIQIGWSFLFDSITVSMLFIITFISFLVHFYSIYYMYDDKHYPRFMAYLSIFTFFMILLVTSNNLLLLFFGWEGMFNCLKWFINLINNENTLEGVLCSGTLIHKKLRGDQRIGPHNFEIIEIIIGSLLGDSHLEKRNNGYRLIFEQSNKNVEYLMWFHQFLASRGYCNSTTPKLHKRIKKKNEIFYHYRINTYTFNNFSWIHEMFYKLDPITKTFIKVVPLDLDPYLTPFALAIWFSDDGSRLNKTGRIATNCFTLTEVESLCNLLNRKFKIQATTCKGGVNKGHIIYFKKETWPDFVNLVKPYMRNSLLYKLGL